MDSRDETLTTHRRVMTSTELTHKYLTGAYVSPRRSPHPSWTVCVCDVSLTRRSKCTGSFTLPRGMTVTFGVLLMGSTVDGERGVRTRKGVRYSFVRTDERLWGLGVEGSSTDIDTERQGFHYSCIRVERPSLAVSTSHGSLSRHT